MSVSSEQFRNGMRRLGGAVNIVTSACGDTFSGLTATAVTSLSAEPPRLLACINRAGATFETISKGRCMAVNVLGAQHKNLAMRFAGMEGEPETDRFAEGLWKTGTSGAPIFNEALVSFDCEIESILDAGSHGIVIGTILDICLSRPAEDTPLCYIDGNWATMSALE